MKTGKPLGINSPWDIGAAVMSVLLYGNFLVFLTFCVVAMGLVFVEPVVAMATAVILLLGIICHFLTRRRSVKIWRRLLLGGIAANFLIVAFYVLIFVLMLQAWQ